MAQPQVFHFFHVKEFLLWYAFFIQISIGTHQGYALSLILFHVNLHVVARGVSDDPPLCQLSAGDKIFFARNRKELACDLERWRYALESRVFRTKRTRQNIGQLNYIPTSRLEI